MASSPFITPLHHTPLYLFSPIHLISFLSSSCRQVHRVLPPGLQARHRVDETEEEDDDYEEGAGDTEGPGEGIRWVDGWMDGCRRLAGL